MATESTGIDPTGTHKPEPILTPAPIPNSIPALNTVVTIPKPRSTSVLEPIIEAVATVDQSKEQPKDLPNDQSEKSSNPAKSPTPTKDAEPAVGEKKLSGAELKKKAKEEKAARRAQAAAAKAPQPQPGGAPAAAVAAVAVAATDGKGKPKPKQDGPGSQGSQQKAQQVKTVIVPVAPKEVKPIIPECFSHLSVAKRINITQADKDVHPSVLMLGQQMSHFALKDSISRLEATLHAFKEVIESYSTPHGNTFSRHFTSHVLNPQIDYLTACRPMCFSMGNGIRWLKLQISKVDIDLSDAEAKKILCQAIDNYIDERITVANYAIIKKTSTLVTDGSVILTYAHHHLVERSLLLARADGKQFHVIVVDDPYEPIGMGLAKTLAASGVTVSYTSGFGALRSNLKLATRVIVGAEAMFSNGAMYARAGTCDIATAAAGLQLRVVALCETINFTDRMSIDSLTYNEIDPERNTADEFRLMFDTTGQKYISTVVTEMKESAPSSVPAVLRKLEDL